MPSMSEVIAEHTELTESDHDRLTALVAEWQLVSDLSFADLVLWVRSRTGEWLAVAHMRPTTGATAHPEDVVGAVLAPESAGRLERACRDGRIKKGDLVLMEAMGGGFTWGAVLVRW